MNKLNKHKIAVENLNFLFRININLCEEEINRFQKRFSGPFH
jgi:hypothetical protein